MWRSDICIESADVKFRENKKDPYIAVLELAGRKYGGYYMRVELKNTKLLG